MAPNEKFFSSIHMYMSKALTFSLKFPPGRNLMLTLVIIVGAMLALFVCLQWLPATFVNGEYIPMGPDSFYHARRIMDFVVNNNFYQFDKKIHVPEGSLLTWPWVYDYMIAQLTKIIVNIFHVNDPMSVITYIPTLWVIVNVLVIFGIMSLLGFTPLVRLIGVVCFSLLPLTQELHAAGRIDHHYMELSVVLLTLFAGLYWFNKKDSKYRSILLGMTLGLAPGINNGLFIVQIPLLVFMFQLWRTKTKLNSVSIAWLGVSAIFSQLLILLPSKPFIDGQFSYYYLSSFHLYIVCCTVLILGYFHKYTYGKKSVYILVLICLMLSYKVSVQIYMGGQFLTGEIVKYDEIRETDSVLKQLAGGGGYYILSVYSGLLVVAPVVLVIFFLKKYHNKNLGNLYLFVYCIFGVIMLLMQKRLHYYGSFALIIPLLTVVNEYFKSLKVSRILLIIVGIVVCFFPSFSRLFSRVPVGNTFDYALTKPIFPVFRDVCKKEPGIVLTDFDDGHYIRFHTECSVIANNFVITPQHQRKVVETDNLFNKTIEQLQRNNYPIRYIYVRRQDNIMMSSSVDEFDKKNKGLRKVLLGDKSLLPNEVELIKELVYKMPDERLVPFARLFKLQVNGNQAANKRN